MSSRGKQGEKVLYKSNNKRCTSVNPHANIKEPIVLNKQNSDNVIGNSNVSHINVQNDSPFNALIYFQKSLDIDSSVIINGEITDKNNISEYIYFYQDLAEIIDHACDENGINLLNTEEEVDIASISFSMQPFIYL